MDYFAAHGCVCADHSFGKVEYLPCTEEEAAAIFHRLLAGGGTDNVGLEKLKGNLVLFLGREYARRGWVQQYHIGALRNNSGRSFKELGPDAGFDAMNDLPFAEKLAALLDALDRENSLPKTVLYCLNPKDNETLAALINCFPKWRSFPALSACLPIRAVFSLIRGMNISAGYYAIVSAA